MDQRTCPAFEIGDLFGIATRSPSILGTYRSLYPRGTLWLNRSLNVLPEGLPVAFESRRGATRTFRRRSNGAASLVR